MYLRNNCSSRQLTVETTPSLSPTYINPMPMLHVFINEQLISIAKREKNKENQMDTRPKVPSRSYEDFQPSFEWKDDEGSETLVITLPGMFSIPSDRNKGRH